MCDTLTSLRFSNDINSYMVVGSDLELEKIQYKYRYDTFIISVDYYTNLYVYSKNMYYEVNY